MRKLITFYGCLIFSLILLFGSAEAAAQMPFKSSHQLARNKLIKDNVNAPNSQLKGGRRKPASRVITTQPEGELKSYNRTGQYDYLSSGYLCCGQQDGNSMDIVYGEDGKVYLKNILCGTDDTFGTSWVEGTIDGNVITVPLGQSIAYVESYDAEILLCWGSIIAGEEESYINLDKDDSVTKVTYVIDGETITMQNTEGATGGDSNNVEDYFGTGLSAYWSDDDSWTGFIEWNTVLTEREPDPVDPPVVITPEVITEIPEGCKIYTYYRNTSYIAYSPIFGISNGTTDGKINIAFDTANDDVYVKNPSWWHDSYGSWVKGTLDPETGIVSIPTGQFLMWNDADEYGVQFGWGSTYVYESGVDEETGDTTYSMGYELDEQATEIQLQFNEDGSFYLVGSKGDINAEFPNNYEATGMMTYYSDDLSFSSIEFANGEQPMGVVVNLLPPPTASIPSGSVVVPGTRVYLNQDVPIDVRYAIETAPFNEGNASNLQWQWYDRKGIPIDQDMRIHAYAEDAGFYSNTVTFTYYAADTPGILENVSFTVDKTDVCVGDYQTYRVQYKIKDEYIDKVSNMELVVDLPQSCPFYENSVMIGDRVCNYTVESNRITIPLEDGSAIVRFCATPTSEGDYTAHAVLVFDYDDNLCGNIVGNVQYSAYEMSLRVPLLTGNQDIMVSGRATKGKSVKVYDGDVLIGQTNCLTNGSWKVRCNLYQPVSPSIHTIHAVVTTINNLEFYTEYKDVEYREFAPYIDKIDMIYQGGTYRFDYVNGTALPSYYSYNPSVHGFTFVAYLSGTTSTVSNLKFKVLDTQWNVTTYNGNYDAANHRWTCSAIYNIISRLPTSVGLSYDYTWEGQTYHYETVFTDHTNGVTPNIIPCIDPSGYVYEGVPSNRLQGVTATCYYKDPTTGEAVLWDAAQYEQENPLITNEEGFYRWDVPIGTWQVKYEKEGYQTTYSDWLPVPPPQLDVNIGMKQMTPPQVIRAHAYAQSIDFEFDKYMIPALLTTDNISVIANGKAVNGKIELLNEECTSEGQTFASRLRFIADQPFNATRVTLRVKSVVESYAGVSMENDYEHTFNVENEMQQIVADEAISVPFLGDTQVTVSVLPADAAAGKTLNVKSQSPMIASVDKDAYVLDENGQAVITVHGYLLGSTLLSFSIQDYDLTATTVVNVEQGNPSLKGDVNGDGEVNIADVNALIDIIAGGAADDDTRYRADVNGDGEVNIADINAVIDIILNPANNVGLKVNCGDLLHVDDVTMKPGDVRTLQVTLDRAARYSAVQCDLVLPAGLTLVDAHAVGANVIKMGSMDDFTNRVLSYSMNKLPFVGDTQPVMTFTVRADVALAPESEITLTHVVLADAANKAWRTGDCTARVNNASGITDVTATASRVWVEKHTLCIESSEDGTARIATVSGMVNDLDVKAGITRHELEPGIYVVILDGQSYKISVK